MLHVILVKRIIISHSVRKFNINRRIPRLHQFQIYQQPPGSAVTVNERVYPLKLDMKPCQLRDNMLLAGRKIRKQLFHHRADEIGLHRLAGHP